jgi:hypothetical protein
LRHGGEQGRGAVENVMPKITTEHPDSTPEQIQSIGQAFFTVMAIEQQDPKAWFLMQQLELKKQRLAFDETRWEEGLRTKLEYGLDAAAEGFKANPQALELYRQARAMIEKETG